MRQPRRRRRLRPAPITRFDRRVAELRKLEIDVDGATDERRTQFDDVIPERRAMLVERLEHGVAIEA